MENKETIEEYKSKNFTSLLGGIIFGSLLTAYCWIPSSISVKDINEDKKTDVIVEQMNGVKRNYMQQQNGTYKLDMKYLDDLLTITPW